VTTYLVANAVSLTASSFLARRFGRKTFFLACLGLFTTSSVLCGMAWNLQSLLLFRILQGFGGGGMVPVSQSILADAFPPEKRGQAFALFGVAVVVAPVVGPTLGGWLSDNYSWHWCFLINCPVGMLAMALIAFIVRERSDAVEERRRLLQQGLRFDLVGFVLVATFLGALEIVLDRGLEDDWFGSSFIVAFAIVCALAFVLMIPWEMTRQNPVVDIRMVSTRQFGSCFVVMLATGIILFATTQFLPQLVQEAFGYTATWAGLVLSPGGLITMAMMFVVGRLSGVVQPKYLIATGAAIVSLSMYDLTNLNGDLDFWFFANSRMLLGLGLPLIFIPIITAVRQDRSSLRVDERGAQCRRLDRSVACRQCIGTSGTVPSEPVDRAGHPVQRSVPTNNATGDTVFRRARQLTGASPAAGVRLDSTAGADSRNLSRLHRCLLDADADLRRSFTARAHPAPVFIRSNWSGAALTA